MSDVARIEKARELKPARAFLRFRCSSSWDLLARESYVVFLYFVELGPRPPVRSMVRTPPASDQVWVCSPRSDLVVMTSFGAIKLRRRSGFHLTHRDLALAAVELVDLRDGAVGSLSLDRQLGRRLLDRHRPAAHAASAAAAAGRRRAAAGSTSGAQLPEKSGFACANAMVATASTAVAMIPILARFIMRLL